MKATDFLEAELERLKKAMSPYSDVQDQIRREQKLFDSVTGGPLRAALEQQEQWRKKYERYSAPDQARLTQASLKNLDWMGGTEVTTRAFNSFLRTFRLSFATADAGKIEEGVERLRKAACCGSVRVRCTSDEERPIRSDSSIYFSSTADVRS